MTSPSADPPDWSSPVPDMKLIKDGWVVSMDPVIGEVRHGSILVEGSRIVQVGADLVAPNGCEVIDAAGTIVIPGLIDMHKHLWQTPLRGIVADLTLIDYFTIIREQKLARFRPEDVGIGTYAGALELIDSGTTTVLDHSHGVVTPQHADALAEAMLASGVRGVWAYGYAAAGPSGGVPAFATHADKISDAYRVRSAYFGSDSVMRMGIAPGDHGRLPLELVEAELRSAKDMDAIWTAHTHCPPGNMAATRGIHTLLARGHVDERAVLSHCNELGADDFALIADSGAHFVSTPDTEMGFGIPAPPPYAAALASGVTPCLGTDCVTCMSTDMFSCMRLAMVVARSQVNRRAPYEPISEQTITTRDVLGWATMAGARALGLDDEIGSLSPGKAADIVLVDATATNMFPALDPVASLVLHAHAGNVDTVLIDGVVRKRHGRLLDVDLPKLRDELSAASDHVMQPIHA